MIVRVLDAIREALQEVQSMGFVIIPSMATGSVDVFWPGNGEAPDVEERLIIFRTSPELLSQALMERTVSIPLWLFLGYPWDKPLSYWKKIRSLCHSSQLLETKKRNYAEACIQFYQQKNNISWKEVFWEEPWSIIC